MNYNLNLNGQWFHAIKMGTKKIEGRTDTDNGFSYKDLKPFDTITFTNKTTEEKMAVEVVEVRHYPDTKSMLEKEKVENVLPGGFDIKSGVELYNSFTNYKESIEKNGIYAIEIKIKP